METTDKKKENPLVLTREFLMNKKRQELIEQNPSLSEEELDKLVDYYIKRTNLIDLPFKNVDKDES